MKVEHNTYTGAEYLPGVRLGWSVDAGQLLWANVARTVRAPSRIDRDFYAPITPIMVAGVPRYLIGGGPEFQSEVANVAELGYRIQPSPQLSFSATAFYSQYDRLRTLEPNTANLPNTGLQEFRNMGDGHVRGIEMWGRWQPVDSWRLNAGFVVQSVRTGLMEGSKGRLRRQRPGHQRSGPPLAAALLARPERADPVRLDAALHRCAVQPQGAGIP
jgi:iron complex outermembrane receptor protein